MIETEKSRAERDPQAESGAERFEQGHEDRPQENFETFAEARGRIEATLNVVGRNFADAENDLAAVSGQLGIGAVDAPGLEADRSAIERFKGELAALHASAQTDEPAGRNIDDRREEQENREENNKENSEQKENKRKWYEKAAQKADGFLGKIDPELRVAATTADINFYNGEKETDAFVLSFKHGKDSRLDWTMSIEPSDEYLDGKFESAVENIYQQQMAQNSRPDRPVERTVEEKGRYERAAFKARDFIKGLDPALEVGVARSNIYFGSGGKKTDEFVLLFTRGKDKTPAWTMQIGENEEYLNGDFKKAVAKIYQMKKYE
jgi:hypothetical protein